MMNANKFTELPDSSAQSLTAEVAALKEENQQLRIENKSLVDQVMHDFEELAVLRSVAEMMELPSESESPMDIALRALSPLTGGIEAKSIAIVLNDGVQAGTEICWTNDSLAEDADLIRLIDQYRESSADRTVIRNRLQELQNTIDRPGALNEWILVRCASGPQIYGWVLACNYSGDTDPSVSWSQHGFTTVQVSLLETAIRQLAAQLHNLRLFSQRERLFTDVVRALINAVEARDPYTCGHSERVAEFARQLAIQQKLPASVQERVYLTGLLHDIGKIGVSDDVLRKPGKLNKNERSEIEKHTEAGWRILEGLDALHEVLPGVLFHHERFDGHGYPDGLVGTGIPLDGRILAICDSFDAMTSDRPYRDGMPVEQAVNILQEGAGSYWDPDLVETFLNSLDIFEQLRVRYKPRVPIQRQKGTDHPIN